MFDLAQYRRRRFFVLPGEGDANIEPVFARTHRGRSARLRYIVVTDSKLTLCEQTISHFVLLIAPLLLGLSILFFGWIGVVVPVIFAVHILFLQPLRIVDIFARPQIVECTRQPGKTFIDNPSIMLRGSDGRYWQLFGPSRSGQLNGIETCLRRANLTPGGR